LFVYKKSLRSVIYGGGNDIDNVDLSDELNNLSNKLDKDRNKLPYKNKVVSKLQSYDSCISIKQSLTSNEKQILRSNYPDLNIQFLDRQKEMHAFSHASRILERRTMLQSLNVNGFLKNKSKLYPNHDFELCDVGGRVHQNINDKLETVHVESPVLSSRDYSRVLNDCNIIDKLSVRDSNDKLKGLETMKNCIRNCIASCIKFKNHLIKLDNNFANLPKALNKNLDYWCFSPSQFCKSTAKNLMFLHSLYDITPQTIIDIFKIKKSEFGMATLLYDFDIFDDDCLSGTIEHQNCNWTKSLEDDTIRFYFNNDSSFFV